MPRPRFEPTAEQRKTLEIMAAYGIPEEQIASTTGPKGIDPKTLRKHFRRELLLGATKANSKVAEMAYQMAISGKSPVMTIFWLKCRGGWKEKEHAGLKVVAINQNQLAPEGNWRVWLILAGRGFGKTRSGAEWVREQVERQRCGRIALVAETAADARNVMVEGESGILAISRPDCRPVYEPSKRRLQWPNGAVATTYAGDEPDQLRGPQHDAAWADEPAKWKYPTLAWDNMELGLRHDSAAHPASERSHPRSHDGGNAGQYL